MSRLTLGLTGPFAMVLVGQGSAGALGLV